MKLISTYVCKTYNIGVNDNLFGGQMLAWLDEAGGILAASVTNSPNVITLKMEEVLFKLPVKVKEQIRIYGQVDSIGRTSIAMYLEARRYCFRESNEEIVCSTKIVYVKVGSDGRPVEIDKSVVVR